MNWQPKFALLTSFLPLAYSLVTWGYLFYDRYVEHIPEVSERGPISGLIGFGGFVAFVCWVIAAKLLEADRRSRGYWQIDTTLAAMICGFVAVSWGLYFAYLVFRSHFFNGLESGTLFAVPTDQSGYDIRIMKLLEDV